MEIEYSFHASPILAGRTVGGAYAGATAGHGTGASAAIGGSVDGENGAVGGQHAESHSFGKSKSVVKLYDRPVLAAAPVPADIPQQPSAEASAQTGNEIVVKKTVIKKKYVPEVSGNLMQLRYDFV